MNIDFVSRIIELIFLIILLSYYFLLFKKSEPAKVKKYSSLSLLIPARNEARYIGQCIESAIAAEFIGRKEIIVIDDSSTDHTYEIAKKYPVTIIRTKKHSGKAFCLNKGIKSSKSQLVAVVDADSIIEEKSLSNALKYLGEDVAGVTSIIKVKNRKKFLGMWLHIEQIYNSLMRSFYSKVNANIVTPGPLSIYRREDLLNVGLFETRGYSEDIDITIKLIRNGKRIAVSEESIAETNMPVSFRGFIKQRTRFIRGWIHIFKKHLRFKRHIIDYYSLPLALFTFIQASVMSLFISWQIISGFNDYFLSQGVIFNWYAVQYFFGWFSFYGIANWIYNVVSGQLILGFFGYVGLLTSLLTYPLYFIAIFKFDRKLDIYHLFPLFFMFPYWFIIMILTLLNLPEVFLDYRHNKWEKIN